MFSILLPQLFLESPLSFIKRSIETLSQRPLLVYSIQWTIVLTLTVMAASFLPELAFVFAMSQDSGFLRACEHGAFRVPLDVPHEVVCLPASLFRRSEIDFMVPPVFAAMVVIGSAGFVHAMVIWRDAQ
ncbi:hypothetical protein AMTRI_Chr07g27260 [Amborella trichopoda]|uniref:Uncharacterized protein n=1 Tax=Amborella trichopoda TaxID=13333 RepID=W1PYA1_AMBTC|nr:uncharacterized protein LOC18441157 [Amborella trichopoda]ERN12921.1 hypothetical protein AMTR_s00050p00206640 [Amborella trichopoda]|eukprot:XP_006851340.1 uncharacterized protein LOC18441157 [Amborella trichopoda]